MLGRIAFWLGVVAIPVALPFAYSGIVVLAVEVGLIFVLLGVGMLRAQILPRVPVVLFARSRRGCWSGSRSRPLPSTRRGSTSRSPRS
jgi:hypothetical protein